MSCISACGRCRFCREGRYGQCQGGGGWVLGHLIDGVQAESVRIPFADGSVHALPTGVTDEAALMLADILPTSYEVGAVNGGVRPGDTVVIVGAGPIGLAAVMSAGLYSPLRTVVVDPVESRRAAATAFGADRVLSPDDDVAGVVRELTGGLGADVAIEAVGIPATFDMAVGVVRPGGRVANVGVHGKPTTLHLEDLWIKDVTITTGLVDTHSTPMLLAMLQAGRIDVGRMVTHRFGFDEVPGVRPVRRPGGLRGAQGRRPPRVTPGPAAGASAGSLGGFAQPGGDLVVDLRRVVDLEVVHPLCPGRVDDLLPSR